MNVSAYHPTNAKRYIKIDESKYGQIYKHYLKENSNLFVLRLWKLNWCTLFIYAQRDRITLGVDRS